MQTHSRICPTDQLPAVCEFRLLTGYISKSTRLFLKTFVYFWTTYRNYRTALIETDQDCYRSLQPANNNQKRYKRRSVDAHATWPIITVGRKSSISGEGKRGIFVSFIISPPPPTTHQSPSSHSTTSISILMLMILLMSLRILEEHPSLNINKTHVIMFAHLHLVGMLCY